MTRGHRRYPGPFGNTPPWGMCRWCGLWIKDEQDNVLRDKKFCGPVCETHYQLRSDPQKMRQHIFFRDGGKCAECGTTHPYLDGEWENDHIIPLMVAYADPSLWEPENCRVLCVTPCHAAKSSADRRKYQKKYRRKVSEILGEIED